MKKSLKILSFILTLVMMVSVFAGCEKGIEYSDIEIAPKEDLDPAKIGDYGTLELPIDTKGATVTALCDTSVTTNNDSVVIKELRRRTGVNVQIIAVPRSSIKEKAKVLVASQDEMPDLLYPSGFSQDEIIDLGQQGAFVDIIKYKDKLPNFKKIYIDEAEQRGIAGNLKNMMSIKGELFMFPTYDVNRDVNHGMLYRKDIFDKHGIEMWHDKESFLNCLRQLKKLYPDSTPFVSKTGTTIFTNLGNSWGLNGLGGFYDEASGKWKYASITPEFKEMLDFIKTMYKEGLIDPEFLTATQSSWTSKMTQRDKAFVTWDWIGRLDMFKEQTAATVPEYDLRYAYPIGGKVITLSRTGSGPAIKNSPVSEIALKLCDYLLSDSGAQLMTMGIEGVTYNLDENGFAKYVGFEDKDTVGIDELESKYGMFISGFYRRFDRRSTYYNFSEREQEAQDMMLNKPGGGFLPLDPVLSYLPEEREENALYSSALSKAAEEFATKYVLNDTYGEKEWNEWVAKAKAMNVDVLIENWNDAQARYDAM